MADRGSRIVARDRGYIAKLLSSVRCNVRDSRLHRRAAIRDPQFTSSDERVQ